jgi:hypothetical protein
MAISQQSLSPSTKENEDLLYKVILENDLSRLSPIEKVQHVKNVCLSLNLNPLTKPIQLIKFQGKEIPYFTKDATEQLRKTNNISLTIKDTQLIDDIYMVVVEAKTADGRSDTSTGAVSLLGLKGADKANAFMKAETKAKRRATLSICGLGMLDESELDGLPQEKNVYVKPVVVPNKQIANDTIQVEFDQEKFDAYIYEMSLCKDKESLKQEFTKAWRDPIISCNQEAKNKLTSIKDKFVLQIEQTMKDEFLAEYDSTTGEIKNEASL